MFAVQVQPRIHPVLCVLLATAADYAEDQWDLQAPKLLSQILIPETMGGIVQSRGVNV